MSRCQPTVRCEVGAAGRWAPDEKSSVSQLFCASHHGSCEPCLAAAQCEQHTAEIASIAAMDGAGSLNIPRLRMIAPFRFPTRFRLRRSKVGATMLYGNDMLPDAKRQTAAVRKRFHER